MTSHNNDDIEGHDIRGPAHRHLSARLPHYLELWAEGLYRSHASSAWH